MLQFLSSLFTSKNEPQPSVKKLALQSGQPTNGEEEGARPHIELKIVVVGGNGAGKTSIIRRYTQGLFSQQHIPTIGVDLFSIEIEQQAYKHISPLVQLYFYDVSHAEVSGQNLMRIFEEAAGVITVFDCTKQVKEDAQSLAALDQWYTAMVEYLPDGLPMLLLGNKSDTGSSALGPQSLNMYVQRCGYLAWHLTTAKSGDSVSEAIDMLVNHILKTINQSERESRRARKYYTNNNNKRASVTEGNGIPDAVPGTKGQGKRHQKVQPNNCQGMESRESSLSSSKRETTVLIIPREKSKDDNVTQIMPTSDSPANDQELENSHHSRVLNDCKPNQSSAQTPDTAVRAAGGRGTPSPAQQQGKAKEEEGIKKPKKKKEAQLRSVKYAPKIARIWELVEEFYQQLQNDLLLMQGLWPKDDRRWNDMEKLLQQALEERSDFLQRLRALPSALEVAADSAIQMTAFSDVKKIHIAVSGNVTKWQKLIQNLDTEIALSSHLTLRRSLAVQLWTSVSSSSGSLSSPPSSLLLSAVPLHVGSSLSLSSDGPFSPPSHTPKWNSKDIPTAPQSANDFISFSTTESLSLTAPVGHQKPPLSCSMMSLPPYSTFSSSTSSLSTLYHSPLSSSVSLSCLGSEIDQGKHVRKISALATTTEPGSRSSRRRKKGFGFRNAGKGVRLLLWCPLPSASLSQARPPHHRKLNMAIPPAKSHRCLH